MQVLRNVMIWDSERDSAEQGDIVINDDGRIESIETGARAVGDTLFDGRGHTLAIPGFVNAHTHASMTLLRGLGEELPLMEWLKTKIFPIEERMNPRHIRAGADCALLEMASCGTTCFADMYFFMREVASSVLSAGMRAALCRGLPGDDEAKLKENLSLAEEFHGRAGRIRVQLGPHAPYTVPPQAIEKIVETAKEHGLGIHFHWLETAVELDFFKNELGKKPIQYLQDTGLLEAQELLLAHCVYVDPQDLPLLERENVTLVHNPKSNLKLGSGYAPIREMLSANVRLALGTDGAASNNRLDIWDEMRTAALMHKGYHRDSTLLSARQVLRMATVNGARGLGFRDSGLIKAGMCADMVLINTDAPHYVGLTAANVPEFLVYAGSSADVRATLVGGKFIYRDGEFPTMDREAILAAAGTARAELAGQ